MSKKIFFFDIDDTLFNINVGVPKSAVNAIRKLRENGHLVFVNTGRSMGNIDPYVTDIGFDGYIAGCGSYIEINGEIKKNNLMTCDELDHVANVLHREKSVIIYEGPDYLYYDKQDEDTIKKFSEQYPEVWFKEKFKVFENGKSSVNKLCCTLPANSDNAYLNNELSEKYEFIIHADNIYAELMPKGSSKGLGIKEVVAYYNMSLENTVSFGDSRNDIDMIEVSGLGIAMGNSCEDLKNIANFCTKDLENDGIEYALMKYNFI